MEWTNNSLESECGFVSDLAEPVGKAGASGSVKIFTVIGIIIFM